MANEVQTLELPEYSIEYQPTQIKIHNYEHLAEVVNAYANRYQNVVVTEDTEKDSKEIRAKLRKLSTALDDKRKEIKNAYNEPYLDFVGQIKALQDSLNKSIEPIDYALRELTAKQRENKQKEVEALIAEMAPNYEVAIEDIEIDPKWLNKTTSPKTIVDGIAATMVRVKKEADELATQTTLLTKYAEANNVDPAGWIDQLNQGQDAEYLMAAIDNQVKLAAQRKQQEEARIAEEKTHQEKQGNSIVDTNTGEVVSRSVDLRITATIQQMNALKHYMDDLGIKYERVV